MDGGPEDPTRTTSVASEVAPSPMPRAGTRIGQYVLQTELGRGGMGQVFLALDDKLDRKVAIKFVSVHSPALVARFMAEARVTAKCTHPNIVVIHDISEHQGLPFMVLEYVRGVSLAALLRHGALPATRVVPIALQVARALAYAHGRGVIHRDLKPANILLADDGTVKVVDFGIAKHFDVPDLAGEGASPPPGEVDATAAGEVLGTLQYMAPEQVLKQPIDARVDVWAFGTTLFQMLHGTRPLHEANEAEVVAHYRDLDRPLPSLGELHPELAPPLVALVERCLEKRVENRPQSIAELVSVLDAMVDTPITGERLPAWVADGIATQDPVPTKRTELSLPPPDALARRRRFLLGGAIAALAALAVIALVIGRGGSRGRGGAGGEHPAEARLAELDAELDRLERAGAGDEAERLFQDFLEQERDPEVIARAWLRRGDRQRGAGALDAGLLSYANAYARAGDAAVQRDALVRLASIYLDRWEWTRLAAAIEVYDRRAPRGGRDDEGARLRDRLLLAARAAEARDSASAPTAAVAADLLTGRPTELAIGSVAAVDVDRDGRDELVTVEDGALILRAGDTLAVRRQWPAGAASVVRCAGTDDAGGYVALTTGTDWELRALEGDAPPVPLDLVDPARPAYCLWIDLDGDGRVELYAIGGRTLFAVARDPGGVWRVAIHPLGSEPAAMVGGDLDGDGTGELVVAVGEWRAYDVRVLRAGDGGALRIDDRIRLGTVTDLAVLGRDRDGRALIAALKQDVYPSIKALPEGAPHGAAAGLYVLALGAGRLEVIRRVDLEWPDATRLAFRGMRAVELDGDGRLDLIMDTCRDGRSCDLAALLGDAGGGFAFRALGGIEVLAVIAGDDDPADELVVRVDGGAAPWILGAGTTAVPERDFPTTSQEPPSAAARGDDAIAAAWQRAEELAAIGLVEAAAEALRRLAALGAGAQVKRDALRRAAALLGSRRLPAGDVFEALAELEARGSPAQLEAWLAAVDDYVAAAEIEPARRLIATLLGEPSWPLAAGDRARLEALRGELAATPVVLFGGGALEPPWRVADPTLVHVPPGSHELAVETLVPGVVASLPLDRRDGLLTLSVSATVTRNEWAGSLELRLGPRDRAGGGGVVVAIAGRGGGGIYRREVTCGAERALSWSHADPLPAADEPLGFEVRVTVLPGRRLLRCDVTLGGVHGGAVLAIAAGDERAWELAIQGGEVSDLTSAAARLSRIEVSGFTLGAAAPDPTADAALALANHRPGEALGLLAGAAAPAWPALRLEAIALDESGDRRSATRVLARAIRAGQAPTRDLARLVRARDGQLAPLVRAAYGDRAALVLHEAWANVAAHDLDEPRVRTAIIADLAALPAPSRDTRAVTLALRTFRGEALLAAGRPDEGRRELTDALAIDPGPSPAPAIRERAERAALLLAIDASSRGDDAAAAAWCQRAIAWSDFPELTVDALLLEPSTRVVIDASVRALGRELYRGP